MGESLRASFGSVDVTPSRAVPLSGFADRWEPFSGIAGAIELNGAVLRWRSCTVVLLTGDFLYFSGALREEIVDAYGARHGFGRANVLLGASHTHFAPAIDPTKPGLGEADRDYMAFVSEKARALIGELLATDGEETTLRHYRRPSRHNCNRRNVEILDNGAMGIDSIMSDPGNVCDDALDVLRFGGPGDELRAALVRYACHPICFTEKLTLTPEFPGVVRANFRAAAGRPDLPVLFLQGFAGDMVPASPARGEASAAPVDGRLAPVKRHTTFPAEDWDAWTASLAADAREALAAASDAPAIVPRLSAHERDIPLTDVIDGLAADHGQWSLSMQAIELSADLLFVALSAEPTAVWTEIVSDLAPGRTVIPVGCANQTYGYLPAGRELAYGGYIAGGFFAPFGLGGHFRPDLEETVVAGLDALLAPVVPADAAAYRQRVTARRAQIDRVRSDRELARALYIEADLNRVDPDGGNARLAERFQELRREMPELRRKSRQYDELQRELPALRRKAQRYDDVEAELPALRNKAKRWDDLEPQLPALRQKARRHDEIEPELRGLRRKVKQHELALPPLRYKAQRYDEVKEELPVLRGKALRYDRIVAKAWVRFALRLLRIEAALKPGSKAKPPDTPD